MMSKTIPLIPGQNYHIFNSGNNHESIFRDEKNYRYFLNLFQKHVLPIAETYAYCLLPNHFHFLVRLKEHKDLPGFGNLAGLEKPHLSFSRLFNSYTKAFNKTYQRSGSLFEKPFKRKVITSHTHLTHLVIYIHQNPQRHGITSDFRNWPFSSYQAIVSPQDTWLDETTVFTWFNG